MSYNKNIFLSIMMLVSLSLLFVGCSNSFNNVRASKLNNLPISRMEGSFSINTDNPKETVGDADYVFLARVDQLVNTEYRNPITIETKNGTKEVASPYTNYKITVLKNIKGNLQTDIPIPITKSGGVDKESSTVFLYEDDRLPEVGNLYVFLAYAQEDGSLLISGPNSNILVGKSNNSETSSDLSSIKPSELISAYEKYTTNQVIRERKHFGSKFDANK